jgi:hypothetical protein
VRGLGRHKPRKLRRIGKMSKKYYSSRRGETITPDLSCEFDFPCAYSEGKHRIKVVLSKDGLLKSVEHNCSAGKEQADTLNRLGLLTCQKAKETIIEYVRGEHDKGESYYYRSNDSINRVLSSVSNSDKECDFSLSEPIVSTLRFCRKETEQRVSERVSIKHERICSYKEAHSYLSIPLDLMENLTIGLNKRVKVYYPTIKRATFLLVVKSKDLKGWLDVLVYNERRRTEPKLKTIETIEGAEFGENCKVHRLGSVKRLPGSKDVLYIPDTRSISDNPIGESRYHERRYVTAHSSKSYRVTDKLESSDMLELLLAGEDWCGCSGEVKNYSSSIKSHYATKKHRKNIDKLKKNICELVFAK